MMKKNKHIYAICNDCAEQIYPRSVLRSDNLRGITVHTDLCDICGKKRMLTPIRDYWFALTDNEWQWD